MAAKHGRKWAIASLVCALLALAVAPLVFGLAVADGERWWGAAGVTASGGALIVSFYLAASLAA